MTRHMYSFDLANQINSLLNYLPWCENQSGKDRIMVEVRRIRNEIVKIEEMTRTEKNLKMEMMTVIIEKEFYPDI